ncbi:MAG: hypothetical protein COV59_00940 [Candidatus Magasanikbacteria bacterium CG11_big_fil_rev_8_21_14_0_20_39_34]|uniref:Uncharacterized protein n=1 Tax=Candidatus Magasanikbacteria bacterium CG11_big_fil_rev_8_21_14_0_20_39_34 TaxID=1974653 RepID=A0A2H0N689_9BACT|nr:MAG: hypothetical protein COV59_00940 [Candidatus Magasanikbacteria bacterium CG11_big_fil_rev_8_21_14_0_20_39_34]
MHGLILVVVLVLGALFMGKFISPILHQVALTKTLLAHPGKVHTISHPGSWNPRNWKMRYIRIHPNEGLPFSGRIGFTFLGKTWFFGKFEAEEGEDIYLHTFFGRGSTRFLVHIEIQGDQEIMIGLTESIDTSFPRRVIEFPPTIFQRIGI